MRVDDIKIKQSRDLADILAVDMLLVEERVCFMIAIGFYVYILG